MKKPKISVLLPVYKSEHLLNKIFAQSLFANSSVNFELIIYDNGGTDKSLRPWRAREIDVYPDVCCGYEIIGDGKNIGLNQAINECAKVAKGDWFYLCHTDMHLLPGWDTALLEATKNHKPDTLLLCSRSIEKSSHVPTQLLKDFGTNIESFEKEKLMKFFETYDDKGIVTSYRMPYFFHRGLWEKMTEFNRKNGFGNGGVDNFYFSFATDNDLFFTAYEVKVRKFWMINSSVIYHLSGHSNNQQDVDKDSKDPYLYLVNKWKQFGYNIDMNIDASEQRLVPWSVKIK